MPFHHKASALLVSLIAATAVLSLLFLGKEQFIRRQNLQDFYTEKYLSDKHKLALLYPKSDKNQLCNRLKKSQINQADFTDTHFYFLEYRFSCRFNSFFKAKKPTKEKYIRFAQLADYLDLSQVEPHQILHIRSLAELPANSENDPKIAIAENAINETLPHNFYGIVITDYPFDITGKKMYGTLYSSYDNDREERNLTFRREVINQLEHRYSYWDYLPASEHLMGAAVDE